ncbi:hypothetical protein BH23CHL1_BH23CHL1_14190 [soil metagenome]
MTAESQWLNVQDIAEMLQVKDETVRRWIRRRELPVLELGGPRAGYRIRRDDLDHFIWQRYRMRNQDDSDRGVRTELASSSDDSAAHSTVRVEAVEDERGRVSQRLLIEAQGGDAGTSSSTRDPDVQQDSPYVSLMRRIPGITYVTSANPETGEGVRRRIAFISEQFENLLGGASAQLRESDQAWWEKVHPEDRERVQASRLHSFRTGERLSIEYRILPPGGAPVWVRDEAVLGDDTGGGQPVWQGIVSNISDRKRVEDALQARVRQQEVVAELGEHALQNVDVRTLLNEAVQYVSQTLGTQLVMILELQPGGETLLVRAGIGWRPGTVGGATISAGAASPAGYTLLSNEPVIVTDLLQETRFSAPPLLRDHGVRSGISAIIAGYSKPFGVIGAHTPSLRQFTVDDVNFLQSVANVLASATMVAAKYPGGSQWLSIRDVADTLRVKEETVRRWIRRGELPVIDLGSARAGYRIHPSDLEQFINDRYMKP